MRRPSVWLRAGLCLAGIAVMAVLQTVVLPGMIDHVVGVFPETAVIRQPSMFWQGSTCLSVQIVLLCTGLLGLAPFRRVSWLTAGLLCRIRMISAIAFVAMMFAADLMICQMGFGTPGFVYPVALCGVIALICIWRMRKA